MTRGILVRHEKPTGGRLRTRGSAPLKSVHLNFWTLQYLEPSNGAMENAYARMRFTSKYRVVGGRRKFKRRPLPAKQSVAPPPTRSWRPILPVTILGVPVRSGIWATALLLVTFIVQALSPISTSFDSRWTIPTAISLLDRGDTNLDEYSALIAKDHDYSLECVNADGTLVREGLCQGHYYGWYPVAVPMLAAPVVFALRAAPVRLREWLTGPMLPAERTAFLAGDFIRCKERVEVVAASFFVALTAVVVFLIGRLFLPDSYSAFLALIFAFATSAWSTASRALWQHGPSMLMLSIALYLLLRADEKPSLITFAALPVSFAYLVRPTNSLFVISVTIYIAMCHRRYLMRYLLCALPIAVAFVMYSESIYGRLLPSYFTFHKALPVLPREAGRVFTALAGVLVSPSRGLLIFTPIFLFSIWGMIWSLRMRWRAPLSGYLIAVIIAQWLLLGVYFRDWMGGHCYGPRLFTDLTPFFIFFLIPVLLQVRESASWRRAPLMVFMVLLCASVFIHSRGARSIQANGWNVVPSNVDENRAWEWRDPQFLRGLRLPKWFKPVPDV
jgi:hypothetical protein